MATVAPVFGQIKQGRGFQQFLIRRLKKVNGEWSFICTSHNLLKLFRFRADQTSETRINRFAGNVRPTAWVSDQAGHGVDDYGTVDSKHALSDHFSSEDDPEHLRGPKAPSQLGFVPSMANSQDDRMAVFLPYRGDYKPDGGGRQSARTARTCRSCYAGVAR